MEPDKNKNLKEKLADGRLHLKREAEDPSEWKSDRIRAERRARLAEMKSKEGGKKPIQTHSRWKRLVALIVAIAVVIAVGGWVLLRFGIPQRSLSAVSINDQKISATEMNMMLGLHAMNVFQMQLMYVPENQALLKDSIPDMDRTYIDMLADSAVSELRMNKSIFAALTAADFALSDTANEALELQLAGLPAQFGQAATQSGVSLPIFLESTFGPGAKMADLENYLRESFTVNEYVTDYYNSVDVTDEQMDTYYEENKNQLDMVNYYMVEFKAVYPPEADEDVRQAALDDAADLADEMVEKLDGADNFYDLALDLTTDAEQKKTLERNPASVHHMYATYNDAETPPSIRSWLFDEAREKDEAAIVPGTDASYVVLFESRERADILPYTVRHILIKADRAAGTDEELETAKEKAEDILQEYEDGDNTEEAFADLAKEYSEDGNAEQGGIYEDVSPGYMVSEFENWSMDPARKAGDTTIVQSSFGYHIMYFVSHADTPHWQTTARDSIASEETVEWRENMMADATVTGHSVGLKLVGKSGLTDILFGQSYDPADYDPAGLGY